MPGFGQNFYDLVTNDENQGGPVCAALKADSFHPGGVDGLMGDGSVRFFKSSINGVTWRALGSIAGGEVISADSYRPAPPTPARSGVPLGRSGSLAP